MYITMKYIIVQIRINGEITAYVLLATNIVRTEMDKSLEKRQFLRGWDLAKSIGVFGPADTKVLYQILWKNICK